MNRPRNLLSAALLCALLALGCGPAGLLASAGASPTPRASSTAVEHARAHASIRARRAGSARACRSTGAAANRGHRAGCSLARRRSTQRRADQRRSAQRRAARRSSRRRSAPRLHAATHAHAAPREPTAGQPRSASSQVLSAAVAAALASVCTNVEVVPTPEDLALVRSAVLCLVNRLRAQHGVSPLVTSPLLEQAAESHCAEMISASYFAHVSPSGETPVDRVRATGYIPGPPFGYIIGENLAWGTYGLATPQAIVAAWSASPEHLANMLDASYTETGIGVAAAVPSSLSSGSPGATYAQEFGVVLR